MLPKGLWKKNPGYAWKRKIKKYCCGSVNPMNRKAQFDVARKSIYWMIIGFVITMIVLGVALIFGSYRSKLTHVPDEIPAQLIALRFDTLSECFAFVDPATID